MIKLDGGLEFWLEGISQKLYQEFETIKGKIDLTISGESRYVELRGFPKRFILSPIEKTLHYKLYSLENIKTVEYIQSEGSLNSPFTLLDSQQFLRLELDDVEVYLVTSPLKNNSQ